MKSYTASDAKRNFGDVLMSAQAGPVGIDKNGKPVAVMLSADTYAEIERMKRIYLQQQIDLGMADVEAGRISGGPETMATLRDRITDAKR